jgi:hypothetical protein
VKGLASYEEEKRQVLKWMDMIDDYLLEPNNISSEWVKCLERCRGLLKNQLIQQASSLCDILDLEIKDFFLEMKDRWMREDHIKKDEIVQEKIKAKKMYEEMYDKVPHFNNIDDVVHLKNTITNDIKELNK